eukprot:1148529-Prorocentrum_minimum.AAC.4
MAETEGKLFQGVEREGMGFKMLQKLGWSEGKGLGANEDGIATHVRVKKRRENTGIGADVTENSKFNWTVNTQAFDAVLAGLNSVHGQTKSGSEGESEGDESEEEKKSANDSKVGKKKRKEKEKQSKKGKKKTQDSGKSKQEEESSGSDEDEETSKKQMVVRARGRYQKRELNKNAAAYGHKDLSAILGYVPVAVAPTAAIAVSGKITGYDDSDSDDDEKPEKEAGKTEDKVKRCRIVIEAPEQEKYVEDAETKARVEAFFKLEPNWWGAKTFRSSGRLGATKTEDEDAEENVTEGFSEKKRGFSEADQERLYTATQGGATSGRQGLGIADRPKKVAGARWKGSKQTFGDDSDKEGQEAEEAEAKGGASLKSSKSGDQANGAEEAISKIKWKKATETILNESEEGKLKVKKFVKKVIEHVIEMESKKGKLGLLRTASKDDLKADLMSKLKQSSRFRVCEEFVQYSSEGLKRVSSKDNIDGNLKRNASKENLKEETKMKRRFK